MTVYARHDTVGTLPVGDIFDFSFWTASLDGSTIDQVHGNAYTAIVTALTDTESNYPDGVHFTGVKTHTYDLASFHHALGARESALSISGTSSADALPQELATVLTTRTANPTRSGHGRMYLPTLKVDAVTHLGQIKAEVVDELLSAWHDAWTTMAGSDQGTTLVVVSRKNHAAYVVDSINMGNIFDVQRRRRNRLIEARTSTSLP